MVAWMDERMDGGELQVDWLVCFWITVGFLLYNWFVGLLY